MAAAALLLTCTASQAQTRQVTITVQNLAASNGTVVAPLNFGFGTGAFDGFNIGQVASAAVQRVAELGSGALWLPAFAAADAGASLGTVGSSPLLPGLSASTTLTVDAAHNPYFSFAAMVVPSNDFFLGNDSPTEYRVFKADGSLAINSISIRARDLWDAGTEVFDPAAAAFVGNAGLRADQHSVVARNFAEFAAFNGLTTAAGYTFHSGLSADTELYRINFTAAPVPEPTSMALMLAGLGGLGWLSARRRVRQPGSSQA
jgi:hypothetical protein